MKIRTEKRTINETETAWTFAIVDAESVVHQDRRAYRHPGDCHRAARAYIKRATVKPCAVKRRTRAELYRAVWSGYQMDGSPCS